MIKLTLQGRVERFIKIMARTHLLQWLLNGRYFGNLNPHLRSCSEKTYPGGGDGVQLNK
jgi:hypothetical protein